MSRNRIKHLQLVLPRVLHRLRQHESPPPVLQHWLRQAVRQRLWSPEQMYYARLDPWQHALLQALPPSLREHGLASAALQWRGEGGAWPQGACLHAEWLHLAAGMHDLQLQLPPAPERDEQAQLLAAVQPMLAVVGFDLQAGPSPHEAAQHGVLKLGHAYLRCDRQLDAVCYSPRAGFATRVFDILPQGSAGTELRRLLTEVQMLLHAHPVNERRARHNVPTLNALWLWGAAPLPLVTVQAPQRILSNEPYVRGLAEHLHVPCWTLPASGEALLAAAAEQLLVVLPDVELPLLSRDWLQPIDSALRAGSITQLDVYLDQWRLSLHGGSWAGLRRRLARPRAMAELTI